MRGLNVARLVFFFFPPHLKSEAFPYSLVLLGTSSALSAAAAVYAIVVARFNSKSKRAAAKINK
jgi:hypothetical protein